MVTIKREMEGYLPTMAIFYRLVRGTIQETAHQITGKKGLIFNNHVICDELYGAKLKSWPIVFNGD